MFFPTYSFRRLVVLLGCTASLLTAQPASRSRNPPAQPTPANTAPTLTPPELKLVAQFDRDGDQRLDATERQAARAYLAQHPEPLPAPTANRPILDEPFALEPSRPGEKITPAQVATLAERPLYDPATLRTVFLEFDSADWEAQLTDFARTDVRVPARLTVDGQSYPAIGVGFQPLPAGTSFPLGYKRTLSLALDFSRSEARLGGERTLQLEDARTDPTLVRSILYRQIARDYLPTPQANFVRVVINGESWGIYVSTQSFDDEFLRENFGSVAGARWIASGQGNFAYLGDDPAPYRNRYRMLSRDDPAAWARLIQLCKTLDQTPLSELENALKPQLDVDRALRFLALETALMNQGGYTDGGRGYGIYLDPKGHFQVIPLATESSFQLHAAHEFVNEPRGRPGRKTPPSPNDPAPPKAPAEIPVPPKATPNGTPGEYPRQSGTDLALLLSYSFVNKVDRNGDLTLSREEWLDFARAWFLVIDENYAGEITLTQFTASVRYLIAPPSMRNPKVQQTFSGDDAAAQIAGDLWRAMAPHRREDRVDRDEFVASFAAWFSTWSDPKIPQLTQPVLQRAFERLFSRSVFQADQLYVKQGAGAVRDDAGGPETRGGRGGRGSSDGGGGFGVGGGLSALGGLVGLGPDGLRIGRGRGGRGGGGADAGRVLETYYEPLDPLGPLQDPENILFIKLLAAPSLRARYLSYVRAIADQWLTWQRLGPIAKAAQAIVTEDVKRETHTPNSYIRFVQNLDQDTSPGNGLKRDSTEAPNLKAFIEERRVYLQQHTAPNG